MKIDYQGPRNVIRYIRDHKFNSLFYKNLISILLVLVVPITALVLVIFGINYKSTRQELLLNNHNHLTRIASEMDAAWSSQKAFCLKIAYDSYIQDIAGLKEIQFNEKILKSIRNVQEHISIMTASNSLADSVLVYFNNPQYFITQNSAWSSYEGQFDAHRSIPMALIRDHYNSESIWAIEPYGKSIFLYYNIFKDKDLRGAVLVKSSFESIKEWLSAQLEQPENRFLILDDTCKVLLDSMGSNRGYATRDRFPELDEIIESDLNGDIISIDNQLYVASIQHSSSTGWKYVLLNSINSYNWYFENPYVLILVLILICIIASLTLAWKLSIKVYQPIQTILHILENPDVGVFQRYDSDYSKVDELGLISTLIQQSYFQKLVMEDEIKRRQDMLEKAQNVALQAQINPHFIFNTLESINWKVLAHFKGENEISSMINDFSQLMRLTIQIGDGLTPIRKEIEHARLYLKLQTARFRGKFTVEWQIDDTLLDYLTPCLVLQPIIENAIYHGLKKLDGDGRLVISCQHEREGLKFEVRDNGQGLDHQTLQNIRERLSHCMLSEPDHIGLCNVHQRVQLTFGPEWGVTVNSQPNVGTCVIISLPKVKKPPY